jgi:hypothetical protein
MDRLAQMAEEILKDFKLEEVLEMNDLTEEDVLEILLENGLINEPERYFP